MQKVELPEEVLRVLPKRSALQPKQVQLLRLQEHKGGSSKAHGRGRLPARLR